MRFARLISLLLLLQSRGRATAPEPAATLEVSVRTIYRDIDALNSSGVPIYAERGALGGFRLMEGYRLQLGVLTSEEAAALPLVAMPNLAADLGIEAVHRNMAMKLRAALPESQRAAASEAEGTVHIALASDLDQAGKRRLQAIRSAATSSRVALVTIRGEDESTETIELAALGVVFADDAWHAIGIAVNQPTQTIRAVPLKQVTAVRGTARHFARLPGELSGWWRDATTTETPRSRGASSS